MSTVEQLRRELELSRLAGELGSTPSALDTLAELPAEELAHLRRGLAHGLEHRHGAVFDAFARASALVPSGLAARATRHVIGPTLAGRMAGTMDPARAAKILEHLDTPFLADCCRTLSAEAAASLVGEIDDAKVVATAAELADRDDHATLGRFVDAIDDRRLRLVLDTLATPRHLLLAGAAADHDQALDRVVRLLSPERRRSIVQATSDHPEAAADVLLRLAPASRGMLLDAVVELTDRRLLELLERLTTALRASPHLRAVAASLGGRELAAASRAVGRTPELESAIGRLTMTALEMETDP